jgi:sterol desaturase/sphingolipid hydroxylase (fatty acid hydroxylase superfamily)
VHFAEQFVNRTITVLPFFVIGGDAAAAVLWFALARLWYSRFVHSNIRTNLGPLRHVMVTPQYHRMHHSIEPGDTGKNLGSFLSIWDRMFGTMVRDYDRYPTSGIADPDFPRPVSRSPLELLRTFGAQVVYPFRRDRAAEPSVAGMSVPA